MGLKKMIQFQGCWFAVVLGHAYDWELQGLLIAGLFYLWALLEDPLWVKEILFSLGLALFGLLVDSTLIYLKLFSLPLSPNGLFAPFWILALWGTFSLGLEDFYMILLRKTRLLVFLGAALGPISYYACEEFGVVHYHRPLWTSLTIHAVLWATIFPLIVWGKFRFKTARKIESTL